MPTAYRASNNNTDMVHLVVSKRRLDVALLTALTVMLVPSQLLLRHYGGLLGPELMLYLYALCTLAVGLLAAFLLKHDPSWSSLLCHLGLVALALLLVLPHTLFRTVPLFTLCWLAGAAMWLALALWLDRVPFLSAAGHQYPDVALEEGWQLGAALFRFYQRHERELFHPGGYLSGLTPPSHLVPRLPLPQSPIHHHRYDSTAHPQ